jgi:hypothetical protein
MYPFDPGIDCTTFAPPTVSPPSAVFATSSAESSEVMSDPGASFSADIDPGTMWFFKTFVSFCAFSGLCSAASASGASPRRELAMSGVPAHPAATRETAMAAHANGRAKFMFNLPFEGTPSRGQQRPLSADPRERRSRGLDAFSIADSRGPRT